MLPASTLSAINNVVALHLEPHTTMKVLGAILAPVLNSDSTPARKAGRPGPKPRRATRPRKKPKPLAARSRDARERAHAALKANPDATLTALAKIAGVSRATIANARADLAAGRKPPARRTRAPDLRTPPTERRARAQAFLKDALAHGPKRVSDVEEAATRAHIEAQALEQARADLGIVTSRANTGGAQAVQWGLPG